MSIQISGNAVFITENNTLLVPDLASHISLEALIEPKETLSRM
jgi:hypothetical protein